jgi:hypothetical protein
MRISLSRRWSVAAVVVALSAATASSAVAAVQPTTTTKKAVTAAPVRPAATTVMKKSKPTALMIAVAHPTVTAKTKFQDTITGTLTSAKVAVVGQPVRLQERKVGARTWLAVGTAKVTGRKGHATFVVTQANAREQYELVFAAHGGFAGSHSAIVTIVKK